MAKPPARVSVKKTWTRQQRQVLQRILRRVGILRFLGLSVIRVEPGRAIVELGVQKRFLHMQGFLHGGILATVADTAAALALVPMVPRGTRMATVEMKINFLERVHAGRIRVVAWIVRKGQSLAVGEADVKDLKGRLLAKSLMTYSFSLPQ